MRRILAAALAYLLLAAPAYACAEESRTFFAMDTAMSLRIWGGDSALADACVARIEQLEALFSPTAEDSEIARLNRYGACELSEPTSELLNFALDICEATGGALDVTLYPVVRAWGFTTGEYRVPDEAELSALLAHVDYRGVQLSAGAASLEPGAMVDLGSVAKGYASDELAELLRAGGVTSALIDLGGNIYCLGGKADGSDWRIGVRDPFGEGYCAVLTRSDCAIVTSGSYERYFEAADGTRYGHIFDPSSGRPVENDLVSVTVTGESGALCDALSTALFVMGSERAAGFLSGRSDVSAILMRSDETFLVSRALAGSFAPAGAFDSWTVEWLD